MKTLKEALLKESLFSKNNLENNKDNKYGITQDDIKGRLGGFPIGIVVRMMEEQEKQGNEPDVKVFQKRVSTDVFVGGFSWNKTDAGVDFWWDVINEKDFDLFFKRYPEYEKYN